MPIAFYDEQGIQWTVLAHPAPQRESPDKATLVFTSEAGERRTCEGCLPEGGTWDEVDERVWCALVRHADIMPAGADAS